MALYPVHSVVKLYFNDPDYILMLAQVSGLYVMIPPVLFGINIYVQHGKS